VDKAILDRFRGRHPVVPFGILADPLDRLSGLGGDDLGQSLTHLDDLACFNVDVGGRAVHNARWLMQQEARVRQAEMEFLLTGCIYSAPAEATQPVPIM
jgi:hypothetical protein